MMIRARLVMSSAVVNQGMIASFGASSMVAPASLWRGEAARVPAGGRHRSDVAFRA
jgi:hypothetical protein